MRHTVFQDIDVLGFHAQFAIAPLELTETVLEQPLSFLHRCREVGTPKGQGGEQARCREISMEQPTKPPLCVPPMQPLLHFRGGFPPLPPPLCFGVYWKDGYFQIVTTIILPLSICSLHICSLSHMVVVLIPYTSSAYGKEVHPVGKSYASKVDDEKSAFWKRNKYPTA